MYPSKKGLKDSPKTLLGEIPNTHTHTRSNISKIFLLSLLKSKTRLTAREEGTSSNYFTLPQNLHSQIPLAGQEQLGTQTFPAVFEPKQSFSSETRN